MDATIAVIAAALAWNQAQGQGVAPPRPKVPAGLTAPRLVPSVIPGARPELPEEKPAEGEAVDAAAAPAPAAPEPAAEVEGGMEPEPTPVAPAVARPIASAPPAAAAPVAPMAPVAAPTFDWSQLAVLTMLFPAGIAAGWLLNRSK
ncbi:MAG: hypothetical protein ACKOHI_08250 [Phycisphaerales bacterium]